MKKHLKYFILIHQSLLRLYYNPLNEKTRKQIIIILLYKN
jgi:hypothetical protein